MPIKTRYYFVLTILFLYIGYLLSSVYRVYIYSNGLNDYGLADIGNNLIFVPGVYFLILLVRNKPMISYFLDILLVLTLYITVELLQWIKFIPGTFDFLDIIGLIGGAMITFVVSKFLHKF